MSRFYICEHCGNQIGMIFDSGVNPHCCGEPMKELNANTVDASNEKHLPIVTVESDDRGTRLSVKVGSVEHPMTDKHYIQWIFVETNKGGHRRALTPTDKPEASFKLSDDELPIAVYEYCNLHGLWKTTL